MCMSTGRCDSTDTGVFSASTSTPTPLSLCLGEALFKPVTGAVIVITQHTPCTEINQPPWRFWLKVEKLEHCLKADTPDHLGSESILCKQCRGLRCIWQILEDVTEIVPKIQLPISNTTCSKVTFSLALHLLCAFAYTDFHFCMDTTLNLFLAMLVHNTNQLRTSTWLPSEAFHFLFSWYPSIIAKSATRSLLPT